MTNKDLEQDLVLDEWKAVNYRGTYKGVTGVGKTRVGVRAIGENVRKNGGKWLVLTPTTNLKDNEWVNEFKLWGYGEELLNNVELMCYQSAYKLMGTKWAGVIADEIHAGLAPEYRKVFLHNQFEKILGLTATIDNLEYLDFLNDFAPIFYETTLSRATSLGLVADHKVYNLAIEFTPAEKAVYNRIQSSYEYYEYLLGGKYKAFEQAENILKGLKFMKVKDELLGIELEQLMPFTYLPEEKRNAAMFFAAIRNRKNTCINALNKIQVTKQILNRWPDRKSLVFSESTMFADVLQMELGEACVTFHSKMDKKGKKRALEQFADPSGPIKVISSVKALNAGFNVPECSLGICASGSGKVLDDIQRKGRTLRAKEGKMALYFNLFVKDTQEFKWVAARTKGSGAEWITALDQLKL